MSYELGHHVDGAHGEMEGLVSSHLRRSSKEPPITSYAPNSNEWFAEHFRLFVTNPDLHRRIASALHKLMKSYWPVTVELRPWGEVLAGADRQLKAARNRILRAGGTLYD